MAHIEGSQSPIRTDIVRIRHQPWGISGGGAYTAYVAAADERVRCAVPVSGFADLECYVSDKAIIALLERLTEPGPGADPPVAVGAM